MEVTAVREDLLLQLNDYKMSKESLERNHSEQGVIFKGMMASAKDLEKKFSSSGKDKRLVKKIYEKLVRWEGERSTVAGGRTGKLGKSVAICFAGMATWLSRAIPNMW